jgi:CheY-like chemotaxis protein
MKLQQRQSANSTPLVMIADSDEDERSFLKAVLKLKGFKVIEAGDGQEALNLAIRFTPDLLLLDLRLPRISGATVLRHIRNQARFRTLAVLPFAFQARTANVRSSPVLRRSLKSPLNSNSYCQNSIVSFRDARSLLSHR